MYAVTFLQYPCFFRIVMRIDTEPLFAYRNEHSHTAFASVIECPEVPEAPD